MGYTYDEAKKEYVNRKQLFHETYYGFFELFEDLYNKDEIKFFYSRNLLNSEQTETIIFFENKFVKATRDELHYNLEEYNYKTVKKELYASKGFEREVRLNLVFDNLIELSFNNIKDSNNNSDWQLEYGQDIRELFKML